MTLASRLFKRSGHPRRLFLSTRSRLCRYYLTCLLLSLLSIPRASAQPLEDAVTPHVNSGTPLQRELYVQARDALNRGRTAEYQSLREQLLDYPLLPYLEYSALTSRLSRLPFAEVDQFLSSYPDSFLAQRLEREWVAQLAREQRWEDIVRYHRPTNSTTVLSCHALRARLQTGDNSAFEEVATLWNVGRSQPNECDPVFEAWMAQNYLTPDIAWQRFEKSLQAGQRSLARYITRLMPTREQTLAELYLLIDNQPERLRNNAALNARNAETRAIILHGVRRLAMIDAPAAMLMLHSHNDVHNFDSDTLTETQRFIAMRLLLQGFVQETESLLRNTPDLATETLVSWILRDAMRNQDWQRIASWLDKLPADAQQTERWTYWRARALEINGTPDAIAQARTLHESLAQTRSFYGFLSADKIAGHYELLDTPVPVTEAQMLALYEFPAVVRAYELYQIGDELNARNEWQHASRSMSHEQIVSSGKLADSWGWHRNSIQAMIQVGYWDDMQLRFPLAYSDMFSSAAREHNLQPHLLLAVARQESAFMHDVRSPAGARGLMQLMPGTARQTAGRTGLSITDNDLYRPDINIALGSRYMAELLAEFNGNRALAAAAYNAGPNRVKQWLRRTADNPLPLDMWIETIPFAETRGYVQNVLAYSVIYGYRMGEMIAFLTEEEAGSSL